jgi:hypothetical protein
VPGARLVSRKKKACTHTTPGTGRLS